MPVDGMNGACPRPASGGSVHPGQSGVDGGDISLGEADRRGQLVPGVRPVNSPIPADDKTGFRPVTTNRYVLTPNGIKTAVSCTKLRNWLLRPLLAADQPQAPAELRAAVRAIDQHMAACLTRARLTAAA